MRQHRCESCAKLYTCWDCSSAMLNSIKRERGKPFALYAKTCSGRTNFGSVGYGSRFLCPDCRDTKTKSEKSA